MFIRSLQRYAEAVERDIGKVHSLCNGDIAILERSKSVIERILNQVRKVRPSETQYGEKVLAERAVPEHVQSNDQLAIVSP